LLTLQFHHFFPLAWSLGESLGSVEGVGAVEVLGVGVDGVAGGPLGGGIAGREDMSEPAVDTSPSPSSCGMSTIAGGLPAGLFSGCRFTGRAGGDGRGRAGTGGDGRGRAGTGGDGRGRAGMGGDRRGRAGMGGDRLVTVPTPLPAAPAADSLAAARVRRAAAVKQPLFLSLQLLLELLLLLLV
jgi:hypothetical protein